MSAASILPLGNLYQLGYTTYDLDRAKSVLADRYGVRSWRDRQPSAQMRTAHAYAGESMIELIEPSADGLPLYLDHMPLDGGVIRLHHLGRRIADAQGWDRLEKAIAQSGLAVPLGGRVMNGDLHYAYVDTRFDLGIYSEYVWLQGTALSLYDDVPQN